MAYIPVYSSRINWENEPSIVSPINATNLNKMDYALKAFSPAQIILIKSRTKGSFVSFKDDALKRFMETNKLL